MSPAVIYDFLPGLWASWGDSQGFGLRVSGASFFFFFGGGVRGISGFLRLVSSGFWVLGSAFCLVPRTCCSSFLFGIGALMGAPVLRHPTDVTGTFACRASVKTFPVDNPEKVMMMMMMMMVMVMMMKMTMTMTMMMMMMMMMILLLFLLSSCLLSLLLSLLCSSFVHYYDHYCF